MTRKTNQPSVPTNLLEALSEIANSLPYPTQYLLTIDGTLTVHHVDEWVVGTFEVENDGWIFRIGETA